MVRGNWQRRVELNDARRQEAKLRKQRQESKKIYKQQAQELMATLDKHATAAGFLKNKKVIHIWTDAIPSDAPPVLDLYDGTGGGCGNTSGSSKRSNGKQRGGRNRSASIENEAAAVGKKKVHPRSKEAMHIDTEQNGANEGAVVPRLCRSHFFTGKCTLCVGGGKKGSGGGNQCRFVHHKKNTTLGDILKHSDHGKAAIAMSEEVVADSTTTGEPSTPSDNNLDDASMDMVYYVPIRIQDLDSNSDRSLSEQIGEALTKKGCGVGSIIYFVVDDQLLYDRYRNGVLVQENNMNAGDHRRQSTGDGQRVVLMLPASILEHTLTFMEDNAVAAMCAVCKAWHSEIGQQSGNLWTHLLQRRNWPLPTIVDDDDEEMEAVDDNPDKIQEELSKLKEAFLSHYVAARDMNAIQSGIAGMMYRKTMDDREGCFRSFESVRGSPQSGNPCVGIKVWSANRFLVAYRHDCTVRLFDSVERSGTSGGRICRELISRSMDPYQNTKKRGCNLTCMALDEEFIGCLLHVTEGGTKAEAFILTILSRNDFLMHDESVNNEETSQQIDVSQSVLNYLLSCDDVDHGLLQLHDFLRDGGDLDDVEVLISPSLVACGYGRFMAEVAVSIPLTDVEDDDDGDESDANMTMLFRKFFLLSSTMGAIIWMADSELARFEDVTLASIQTQDGGRYGSEIAAVASMSARVVALSLDPDGTFRQPTVIRQPEQAQQETLEDGSTRKQLRHRPLVVIDSEVICGQNLVIENQRGQKQYQAQLLFFSDAFGNVPKAAGSVLLDGCIKIDHLVKLRSRHVLVICKLYQSNNSSSNDTNAGTNFLEDVVGHWFGGDDNEAESPQISLYGILMDFQSRKEIQRICLVEDLTSTEVDINVDEEAFPLHVAASGGTVAAAAWWNGVVLTGAEARDSRTDRASEAGNQEPKPSSTKMKKKKGVKKSGKKDGFARGMSLRG